MGKKLYVGNLTYRVNPSDSGRAVHSVRNGPERPDHPGPGNGSQQGVRVRRDGLGRAGAGGHRRPSRPRVRRPPPDRQRGPAPRRPWRQRRGWWRRSQWRRSQWRRRIWWRWRIWWWRRWRPALLIRPLEPGRSARVGRFARRARRRENRIPPWREVGTGLSRLLSGTTGLNAKHDRAPSRRVPSGTAARSATSPSTRGRASILNVP